MSQRTLELLDAIGLMDGNSLCPTDISNLPEAELRGLLAYYRKCRVATLEQEVNDNANTELGFCGLNSSVSSRNVVEPLLPAALVYDRLFLDDPLFRICPVDDEVTDVAKHMIGMPAHSSIDREDVEKALAYFSSFAPLIRDGVVCVLPIALLHEPDHERRFVFSPDGFRSAVPPYMYDYIHTVAQVHPVTKHPNGNLIITNEPLTPVRIIYIEFPDDRYSTGMRLFALHPTEYSLAGDRTIRMEFSLDLASPPPLHEFDAWVQQSINQVVRSRLEMVTNEMALAQRLGASYITESGFEARLCGMAGTQQEYVGSVDAVNFLHAVMDELQLGDPTMVARLRHDYPVVFERFRRSLRSIANELQGTGEGFHDRARQLFDTEIRPQILDVRTAMSKVTFAGIGGGITFGMDIALAVMTGDAVPFIGGLVLATSVGVMAAAQAVPDYLRHRTSPEFIWSKITKR